jgi:hypothetical protein
VQTIHFSLSLDAQRGHHSHSSIGESVVGPLGMLGILETQLGLLRISPSQSERVMQLRQCLADARNGRRFYERSFDADELGTSATLLGWRDSWFEHGWAGTMPDAVSPRLRDMAAVEVLAGSKVAPSVGQRLADVAHQLDRRRPQIDMVILHDALASFPLAWRRVLAKLPVAQGAPVVPAGRVGTLLRNLQDGLLSAQAGTGVPPIQWLDDGSVRVVQGASKLASAQWLAHQIDGADLGSADGLVVAQNEGTVLDAALASADLPRLGLADSSAFRPTLQLVPLAVRLLWNPVDFNALLQFLSHPVHPLKSFARRRMAQKMADAPGIGGSGWAEVLEAIQEHYQEDAASVMNEVRFWVDHPRFTALEQAPLAAVMERVERLLVFFRNRLTDEDEARRAGWHAGHEQVLVVSQSIQALLAQGVERIAPETLDKLVVQATARGSTNPQLRAQAGARACVTDPAGVIEPFDDVFWWHLGAVPLPQPYTWSPSELGQLRSAGVDLPEMDALLARQAAGWLQPILQARQRLTLVLPRAGEELHPVWLLVSSLLKGIPVMPVEATLVVPPVAGVTSAVPMRELTAVRRWWQLPAGAIHRLPPSASFSSLEQLFFNPFHWVLRYPAALRTSALLDLPDEFRLLGNLAHRAVEQLYSQNGSSRWPVAQVLVWFDANVDRIVAEEGAVLLMPGRRADLVGFRLRFRYSLARLHGHLLESAVVAVTPELAVAGDTPLGRLQGSCDLMLTYASGRHAVIDMKWSGTKKYREKLAGQTHVQLGIYGKLQQMAVGSWPSVGYFVLREAEMLTTAPGLFRGVRAVDAPEGSTAQLWQRIEATWAWRQQQIAEGSIELVLDGLEATPESAPPDGALPPETLNARYNPYAVLAGWGAA